MASFSVKSQKACLNRLARPICFGIATLIAIVNPSLSIAQQDRAVELHAFDGSAVINGDLLEVSDGSYVIKTVLGTLRVSLDEAECIGIVCPALQGSESDFSILASSDDVRSLVPTLLSGYAQTIGAVYQVDETDGNTRRVSFQDAQKGKQLASVDLRTVDAAGVPAGDPAAIGSADGQAGAQDLHIFAQQGGPGIEVADDELLLALEGVAVIVHPDNPIVNLSQQAIAELFACVRTDWQSLGGPHGPVHLYTLGASSSTQDTFSALALEPFGVGLCDRATRISSDAELAERVANDPNAIGLIKLGHDHQAKPISVKACALAHSPSAFNVKTGEYPLVRPIFLDAPSLKDSSATVQKFVDFALSDRGQRHLEESNLIGLTIDTTSAYANNYRLTKIEAAAVTAQRGARVTRLIEMTENAARLSATFRFRSGAGALLEDNALDNRAQRDLSRLARYLKESAGDGAEVLLFGFADSSGDYDANLTLSVQRAQSIADKLSSLGVATSVVTGFGEEAPIACNDDPTGRAKNRRVEVWLRTPKPGPDQLLMRAPI